MLKDEPIRTSAHEYLEHHDNSDGLCLACGEWSDGGVEPDAENYECDACEAPEVVGAEQAIILGRLQMY